MNDYLALIGYACLDDDFRASLLAHGRAAVGMYPILGSPELSDQDKAHLDEFMNAPDKPALTTAWSTAADKIRNVCGNPPCLAYIGAMGSPAP